MFKNPIIRGGLFPGLVLLGLLAFASCSGRGEVELSHELRLSADQAASFKSDLSNFAKENGYIFIDGSNETKEARKHFNNEFARSSNSASFATDGYLIDVTVEPKNASNFLIVAKSSAYDAGRVSLTLIYDKTSVAEKQMADKFKQSQFRRSWMQYTTLG
jgi:hypothetical protein